MSEHYPHRLDGLNLQEHYVKVIKRINKYYDRLLWLGYFFDKDNDLFYSEKMHITLEYIETVCDFTHKEFRKTYGLDNDDID